MELTMRRLFLAPATHFVWELHYLDTKNVFLHGVLEEVYMEIISAFETYNRRKKVYENNSFLNIKAKQLFTKYFVKGKLTQLLVYVDDMTIVGDDETEKLTLKKKLVK